jgi:hypothetical protein
MEKDVALNKIVAALRRLRFDAERYNLSDSEGITVGWKGNDLTNLEFVDIGKVRGDTVLFFELWEWEIRTSVTVRPRGGVDLESLPMHLREIRDAEE